jgi:hypothetical protein
MDYYTETKIKGERMALEVGAWGCFLVWGGSVAWPKGEGVVPERVEGCWGALGRF